MSEHASTGSEAELAALATALGAETVAGISSAERSLPRPLEGPSPQTIRRARADIGNGLDPLGEAFCALRTPAQRRPSGATYTPAAIIRSMLDWTERHEAPERVVDPGTGSARFLVAAGRRYPRAELIGVELDPLAALLARANLAAAGMARRSRIIVGDYRDLPLVGTSVRGRTLFVGNPPYVRHHLIAPRWKEWLTRRARTERLPASQLAGLHVHFFLATRLQARAGDYGVFVTAAEWLDVNYGKLVRALVLGALGGTAVHLIDPAATPFSDAAATAAITCFEVGSRPSALRLRRVESLADLGDLGAGRALRRERLETADRWTPLTRSVRRPPEGFTELGELCRVHRGQVTGANKIWIAGPHSAGLPASALYPAVTKARELFFAGRVLDDAASLRKVIDLPPDLDVLDVDTRRLVERFLAVARALGAHRGFVASHRKAWWSVGLREPAPILATYMARRPPAFVVNKAAARHINVAHGLYPREGMSLSMLQTLAAHLARHTTVASGRTYAGGLTKFEPREMERLWVPDLTTLRRAA